MCTVSCDFNCNRLISCVEQVARTVRVNNKPLRTTVLQDVLSGGVLASHLSAWGASGAMASLVQGHALSLLLCRDKPAMTGWPLQGKTLCTVLFTRCLPAGSPPALRLSTLPHHRHHHHHQHYHCFFHHYYHRYLCSYH